MTILDKFKAITTFIFDMDGVLTDGMFTLLPGGVMARRMNVKDGYALQLAVKKGYHVVVISGSYSAEAEARLNRLGIDKVWMSITDKIAVAEEYLQQQQISWHETLYMGDDIPDLEVMKKAGIACCPADAVAEIKEMANYISHNNGGYGCVRDVIEKVMKLRTDWDNDILTPST